MLYFARWQVAAVALILVVAALAVVPNFLPASARDDLPSFLADRRIVLGLDLQGGASLLYQIDREDYADRRLAGLVQSVRATLGRAPAIDYAGLGVEDGTVRLRLVDPGQAAEARARLEAMVDPLALRDAEGAPIDVFRMTATPEGDFRFALVPDGLDASIRIITQRSIDIVGRRVAALGGAPTIRRAGQGRIRIEAPGLSDPGRLKGFAGQPAELEVYLVEPEAALDEALAGRLPPGKVVIGSIDDPPELYLVDETPLLTGDDVATTEATADGEEPVLSATLTPEGTERLAETTRANPGRSLVVAIDRQAISTIPIDAPITDGHIVVAGDLDPQSTRDLAVALASGPLPAKLAIVEERTIAADAGADSIRAGVAAVVVAAVLVASLMMLVYGWLGVVAALAIVVNLVLIVAVMSLAAATLTLPGIAGIVLTLGMSVDANVLIYERIRDETRRGRPAVVAIEAGFSRALPTILDANVAILIAAATMFLLGWGPVRGFAVTLAIGVVTTVFTAYLVTRLLVAAWVRRARPATVL